MAAFAHTRTFRLAIRAPSNGHSLSEIFPFLRLRLAILGTDFGKAKAAGVRQRDRGGELPSSRSFAGKVFATAGP
jgi:hypothetical protein